MTHRTPRRLRWTSLLLAPVALVGLTGCESDSFLNPSTVGRWERTPVTVPILDRVASIESDLAEVAVSPISKADLIPDRIEYSFSDGDQVQITIFEFLVQGQDSVFSRRVDESGRIRLPNLGSIRVSGLAPSELEEQIVQLLIDRKILTIDPQVTVTALTRQEATYSILGQPDQDRTRFGTYIIPRPNFRLLDAIATAGGIDGRVKRLRIIRRVVLDDTIQGVVPGETPEGDKPDSAAPSDSGDILNELEGSLDAGPTTPSDDSPSNRVAPPSGMELDSGPRSGFVMVDGKYVRVGAGQGNRSAGKLIIGESAAADLDTQGLDKLVTQRIIEVPYDRLRRGELKFDVVIRPGDIITVPERSAGFVYIMGATARPGAYTVPGENELTLKQLIASSGGLANNAWPTRVDLIRRIGPDHESTVRLDLKAIFNGTEPDIFLKPNGLINVGTSFAATPLAVFRNGLRATYGFGFIVDRNFADDIFGDQN